MVKVFSLKFSVYIWVLIICDGEVRFQKPKLIKYIKNLKLIIFNKCYIKIDIFETFYHFIL